MKRSAAKRSNRDQDVHVVRRPKAPAGWPRFWGWKAWRVVWRGELVANAIRQVDAIDIARDFAAAARCDVVVHGKTGRIREKNSHGEDSPRRRG